MNTVTDFIYECINNNKKKILQVCQIRLLSERWKEYSNISSVCFLACLPSSCLFFFCCLFLESISPWSIIWHFYTHLPHAIRTFTVVSQFLLCCTWYFMLSVLVACQPFLNEKWNCKTECYRIICNMFLIFIELPAFNMIIWYF